MASSTLLHSPFLPSRPLISIKRSRHPESRIKFSVLAAKRDASGQLVDENMIILRKRIREMEMDESKYEPPSDWMDWEKRCYTSYNAYVCEVMGVLQSGLMNSRPSLALGLMALITLSLPVSTLVLVCNALEFSKGVFSGILH